MFSITYADFGDIDIVESVSGKQPKALTLAAGFQTKDYPATIQPTPLFEWKPWLKPVHAVALRLRGFIAASSTA
jgi:hypothetical protein